MIINKMKQKIYNQKHQVYPLLEDASYSMHMVKAVFAFHFIWFALGLFGFQYPKVIFMFDMIMIAFALIHIYYVIPGIVKGKWNAYYRNDYERFSLLYLIRDVVVIGAFIRWFSFIFLSKGLQLLTNGDVEELHRHLLNKLQLNLGIPLALIAYAGYVYFMYFHQKTVHAGKYNERVYYRVKSEGTSLKEAAQQVQIEMLRNKHLKPSKQVKAAPEQQTPYDYIGLPKEVASTIASTKKDSVDNTNETLEKVVIENEEQAPVNNKNERTIQKSSSKSVSPIEQIYQQRRKQRHF